MVVCIIKSREGYLADVFGTVDVGVPFTFLASDSG